MRFTWRPLASWPRRWSGRTPEARIETPPQVFRASVTVARRPLAVAAVLLLAVTTAASAGAATGGTGPGATQPGPALPALSTRQLVGQHMVLSYAGPTPPAALERRIRAGEAARVVLFGRNIASPARLPPP